IHVVTIKEIERRLRYTDMSIKQVSVSLHFPNTSFFGRYFKQHTGITPTNTASNTTNNRSVMKN
ncbi:MAG: helix-turn-helix domain-containing protein, partial [Bacteroidales bacterium]|nr:helix-turn-helix domain-containing protein [Bacteroidales bacterium]